MNKNTPMYIATSHRWPAANFAPGGRCHIDFQPSLLWLKLSFPFAVTKTVFQLPQGGFFDGYRLCFSQLPGALRDAGECFAVPPVSGSFWPKPMGKVSIYAIKKIEFKTVDSVSNCCPCVFEADIF